MYKFVAALIVALLGSSIALAQTATPVPRNIGVYFEPIPSLTPMPTVTPLGTLNAYVPSGPIYEWLSTSVANVNSLPADLASPNGVSLLPNVDGRQLFAYTKWLFSSASAEETLGPTFAPFAVHSFAYFVLVVFTTSVYVTITLVAWLVRGVIWLVSKIRHFLPF